MTALPPIKITDRDLARLEALLESPAVARLPVAGALAEELARATVVPAADMPADVVTRGSQVICVEETTGIEHRLVLSWPAQADPARLVTKAW